MLINYKLLLLVTFDWFLIIIQIFMVCMCYQGSLKISMIAYIEHVDDVQNVTCSVMFRAGNFFANFFKYLSDFLIEPLSGPSSEVCLFLKANVSNNKQLHEATDKDQFV